MSDLVYWKQDVGHKAARQGAAVYLGPLGPDGQSPSDVIGEGESRSVMILGQNGHDLTPGHCMIVTQDPATSGISSESVDCPINPANRWAPAVRVGPVLYVYGGLCGVNSDALHEYHIENKTWRQVEKRGLWPGPTSGPAMFNLGGKLHMVGGWVVREHNFPSGSLVTEFWQFDPKTEEWTMLPDCPVITRLASAVVVGDTAHILGNEKNPRNLHLTYSEREGWVRMGPMPLEVNCAGVVCLGREILVLGGIGHNTQVHVYDTVTRVWTRKANMPMGFQFGAAARISPHTLVVHSEQELLVGYHGNLQPDMETEREREGDVMPPSADMIPQAPVYFSAAPTGEREHTREEYVALTACLQSTRQMVESRRETEEQLARDIQRQQAEREREGLGFQSVLAALLSASQTGVFEVSGDLSLPLVRTATVNGLSQTGPEVKEVCMDGTDLYTSERQISEALCLPGISFNRVSCRDTGLDAETASHLVNSLRASHTVRELDISGNHLHPDMIQPYLVEREREGETCVGDTMSLGDAHSCGTLDPFKYDKETDTLVYHFFPAVERVNN
ncbi:hypothetical protein KIPB_002284 [Kipferlia bialata]|uniref:Uncharacterized protein n=1 Tax=Kipferlia bialata TaxID=797122 RepID=A0A9K3CRY8_9EUKA|nr:hypothetical protein KIPB_002284 [Kipferlia bialata]|eukprot:g2284.t1